jgi:hypothetical protein
MVVPDERAGELAAVTVRDRLLEVLLRAGDAPPVARALGEPPARPDQLGGRFRQPAQLRRELATCG